MSNWNDSLLVGVALLDDEHRTLIESIERLMGECKEGKSRDEIAKTMNYTVSYAKEHFTAEENLQERYAYPGIMAHKRIHAQFIMSVRALVQDFERTGPNTTLAGKIQKTMMDWLLNHISTEDKKVGQHVQSAGGK